MYDSLVQHQHFSRELQMVAISYHRTMWEDAGTMDHVVEHIDLNWEKKRKPSDM